MFIVNEAVAGRICRGINWMVTGRKIFFRLVAGHMRKMWLDYNPYRLAIDFYSFCHEILEFVSTKIEYFIENLSLKNLTFKFIMGVRTK
jgi:hypothetical protein